MLAAEPVLSTWLPPLLMLIGVSFLGVIMALAVRNHRQTAVRERALADLWKRVSPNGTDRDANGHLGADIPTLRADLLASAERLATTLDDHSRQIEELLAAADQRIADLTALIEQTSGPTVPQHAATAEFAVRIEPKPAASQLQVAVASETTAPRGLDPLAQAVYRLADAGRRPVEIARELQEQTGKVELILALRKC